MFCDIAYILQLQTSIFKETSQGPYTLTLLHSYTLTLLYSYTLTL